MTIIDDKKKKGHSFKKNCNLFSGERHFIAKEKWKDKNFLVVK